MEALEEIVETRAGLEGLDGCCGWRHGELVMGIDDGRSLGRDFCVLYTYSMSQAKIYSYYEYGN